jgi:hypothetical protein
VAIVAVANGGGGGGAGGDNSAISRTAGTNQLHSPDVGKSVRIIFPAGRGDMTPARQLNPTTQPYGALARCTTPAVCFTKWQSPPNPAASLCSVHTAPSPLLEDATSERRWMLVGMCFNKSERLHPKCRAEAHRGGGRVVIFSLVRLRLHTQ